MREILVDKLNARAVLVGANFHFGKRAAGDAATLEELGERYSFETDIIPPVVWREAHDIEQRDPPVDRSRRCFHGLPHAGPAHTHCEGAVVRGRRHRIEANRSHSESAIPRPRCCPRTACT